MCFCAADIRDRGLTGNGQDEAKQEGQRSGWRMAMLWFYCLTNVLEWREGLVELESRFSRLKNKIKRKT